ncbi:Glucan endo-1,3-beta-glucosidase 14 [Hibiscus syriacus]|uniref:glucan endo-1,3-beta-D-glucosidase n=1 Tax=Hibiscus syriacus TaxID=106335 RepID=A0A6A2ZBD6_HIBSY|nr:glucan endo-1,3-beta-glucosidase 14-like [Hibiscus syriacus]KAE8688729.1 Glucan endo-1,3-beta-glucosidase 14 [Hibiscus syriacus]
MAVSSSLLFTSLLLLLTFSDSSVQVIGLGIGINYGQIGNNLPSPIRVSYLLRSLNISRVKLYDADPNVLVAFSNTNVDFIIGLGNEFLQNMTDPIKAQNWVQQRVQPYLSRTRITCITVGNEVFKYNDHQQWSNLLPAMQTVYNTLADLGLDKQVSVTTAHSLDILSVSFPPSAAAFRQDLGEYLHGILNFHAQVKSPFLINAYPYFAYKDNPNEVPLDYVLFQPNQGTMDPFTNLKYDNMLYAQVDAVYYAIKAMGHTDIEVRVSETGWPSKGDENEVGATPENAGLYNGNLLKRIEQRQGTPAKPNVPIDIYVFALFNENLKSGPASERNYGLFYPDGTPVYNIGVQGYLPELIYSSPSINNEFLFCSLLILAMACLIFS